MQKVALFVVVASVLLSGCNRRAEEVKDCSAGKAQPAMDIGQAMSVLKAAGYEVRRPDDAIAAPAQPQAPEQAPPPVQTPAPLQAKAPVRTRAQHQFSRCA